MAEKDQKAAAQRQREESTVTKAPNAVAGAAEPETERTAQGEVKAREGDRAQGVETGRKVGVAGRAPQARETLLNATADEPSFVAPGDAPYDTVDPLEHASSVAPDRTQAAKEGFGVVNAVVPIPDPSGLTQRLLEGEGDGGEERTEEYLATAPTGARVRVRRNIETGESEVLG